MRLARDLGAGELAAADAAPDVVVVAAPPDVASRVVVEALREWPDAVVTDVASVKESILREVLAARRRRLPLRRLAPHGRPGAVRHRGRAR